MENTNNRFLYKAKRRDNGEWVIGSYVNGGFIIKTNHTKCINILEDTLCQCTGMTDNNYKLIFENDIVEFQHKKNDKNPDRFLLWWNKEMNAMTVIDANKCVYNGLDYTGLNIYSEFPIMLQDPYCDFYNIKVIGNIFDNPELVNIKEDYSKSFLPKDENKKINKNDFDLEF